MIVVAVGIECRRRVVGEGQLAEDRREREREVTGGAACDTMS